MVLLELLLEYKMIEILKATLVVLKREIVHWVKTTPKPELTAIYADAINEIEELTVGFCEVYKELHLDMVRFIDKVNLELGHGTPLVDEPMPQTVVPCMQDGTLTELISRNAELSEVEWSQYKELSIHELEIDERELSDFRLHILKIDPTESFDVGRAAEMDRYRTIKGEQLTKRKLYSDQVVARDGVDGGVMRIQGTFPVGYSSKTFEVGNGRPALEFQQPIVVGNEGLPILCSRNIERGYRKSDFFTVDRPYGIWINETFIPIRLPFDYPMPKIRKFREKVVEEPIVKSKLSEEVAKELNITFN